MSLILDALNRARRERGEVSPGGLPTPVVQAPARGPLVPLLVVALALACAVSGWLAWERWGAGGVPPTVDQAPPDAVKPSVGAAPPPRPGTMQSPVGATPSPRPSPAAGDGRRREGVPPTTAPDPAVAALYADPATAAAVSEPAAEPVADPPTAAQPPESTREDRIDIEAVLARARDEMGKPELSEHPAPLLADLSQQQKDAIPTLMYLRHDYMKGGASSVLINGEPRRVGDRIGAVEVAEILPDSVVLRYRGTLFRLRALNSWVNL
ncbi:MAG TPA: general secretion pathway protein GspB [Pseudohaliea sp.]|nr:general secretion pathway protein GspB [Pseudohaliea sp.]